MHRIKYCLTIVAVLTAPFAEAQLNGTRTVCASGCDYATLTVAGGAFSAINTNGLNGNLILEVRDNLTLETGATALSQWTETGGPFTVTIRPDGNTMRTISGTPAAGGLGLIRLTGADRVIIDGRDPGNTATNLTNRYLTINNTSGTGAINTGGPAIAIFGGARDVTIRSAILGSRNTYNVVGSGGVVSVGDGLATEGNDNFLLEYCDIKDAPGSTPLVGVLLGANLVRDNNNAIIRNNNIYNFFNNTQNFSIGVQVVNYYPGVTIEGNSFYQTSVSRTFGSNRSYSAVHINSTNGSGFTIRGNFIGGTLPGCGGSTVVFSLSAAGWIRMRPIYIQIQASTLQSVISNNTISKLESRNLRSLNLGEGNFASILVSAGNVLVTNNTIGDPAVPNDLLCQCNATVNQCGVQSVGIKLDGTAFGSVIGNSVRSLQMHTSGATAGTVPSELIGILISKTIGTQPILVDKNTVGSLTGPVSMSTNDNSALGINAYGISVTSSTGSVTVRRNKVANISSLATSTISFARGISYAATVTAPVTIDRNQVSSITSASTPPSSAAASGIFLDNPSLTSATVSANIISRISNSSAGGTPIVAGILVSRTGTGTAVVENCMVTLGDGATGNIRYFGLQNNFTNTGNLSWHANTVVVTGAGAAPNTQNTYGLLMSSGTPVSIRSNLLHNNRGGGGTHYAIGSSAAALGTSNFNLLYTTNASTVGSFSGLDRTFAGWQAVTVQDANSQNADVSSKFISVAGGDLRIPDDGSALLNDRIIDKGTGVVTTDVDGGARLNTPDIGASEVSLFWLGNTTDWFTATNWSGNTVPSCGGREIVKIRPGVPNQPVVTGLAEFKDLVVNEDAVVTLSGVGQLSQCVSGISPFGLKVNGTLTVSGSQLITLKGDFYNYGTFNAGTGTVLMDATTGQFVTGYDPSPFNNFTANGGGSKTLSQPASVSGTLTLTNGLVTTTSTNLLTLGSAALVSGGSNASYVNGPMAKASTSASSFTFPVGKGGKIRTASVQPNSISPTTFTAEYFNASAIGTFGTAGDPALLSKSAVEYWTIDRPSGTANAQVSLTWDTQSGVSTNPADLSALVVIRWSGSSWVNEGQSGIIGVPAAGTITSLNFISTFSPHTLGSLILANPLPVELLSFKAELINDRVLLTWETASELNNDYFTLENASSADGFSEVARIDGQGTVATPTRYSYWHNHPLPGTSYYRLRQTDYDKKFSYSGVVAVTLEDNDQNDVSVFPNPTFDKEFYVRFKKEGVRGRTADISIYDLSGRMKQQLTGEIINETVKVQHALDPGFYIVKVNNESISFSSGVIVK